MIARLLDFLYPSLCELCQVSLKNGSSICTACVDELPKISDPMCQRCGEAFDGNIEDDFRCQNCQGLKHDFLFARASFQSLATPFHLVHSLKYRKRFFLARDLAPLLQTTLEEEPRFEDFKENTFLVPVPLHWRRQQWRQGNQAFELARELAKISGIPCANSLRRIRSTQTQTKLNRRQRLSNLKGAFHVRKSHLKRLKEARIILIDDVFTTGATAHECTRVLRKTAKTSEVAVLTLVRG